MVWKKLFDAFAKAVRGTTLQTAENAKRKVEQGWELLHGDDEDKARANKLPVGVSRGRLPEPPKLPVAYLPPREKRPPPPPELPVVKRERYLSDQERRNMLITLAVAGTAYAAWKLLRLLARRRRRGDGVGLGGARQDGPPPPPPPPAAAALLLHADAPQARFDPTSPPPSDPTPPPPSDPTAPPPSDPNAPSDEYEHETPRADLRLCSDPKNVVFLVSGQEKGELTGWCEQCEGLGMSAEHGYFIRWNKKCQELIDALNRLCSDPKNVVFLVSGQEKGELTGWCEQCKGLGMSAEHGYFISWNKKCQELIDAQNRLCSDPKNVVFLVSGQEKGELTGWCEQCEGLGMSAEHGYFIRWNKNSPHNWLQAKLGEVLPGRAILEGPSDVLKMLEGLTNPLTSDLHDQVSEDWQE